MIYTHWGTFSNIFRIFRVTVFTSAVDQVAAGAGRSQTDLSLVFEPYLEL